MENTIIKVDNLLRHIHHISSNCNKLGKSLIRNNEPEMGLLLISFGLTHDHSKFFGVEWDNLVIDYDKNGYFNDGIELKLSTKHHALTNRHHPEFWGGIHKMPDVNIAEMVCDWTARATEFGTDVRIWIDSKAMSRYNFTKDSDVYKKIDRFLNMLLDKPFK